ncbi:hypothetical protein D3C72_491800 [compost metagenome]
MGVMPDQPKTPPKPPTTPVPDNRGGAPCDICGYPVLALHCKLSCENCGAKRDCSDL